MNNSCGGNTFLSTEKIRKKIINKLNHSSPKYQNDTFVKVPQIISTTMTAAPPANN